MTNSRQILTSETHHGHLFLIMEYHVADLYTDEDGTVIDEGYDLWTLEEFDLSTGQLVTKETGDLDELQAMMAEAIEELAGMEEVAA